MALACAGLVQACARHAWTPAGRVEAREDNAAASLACGSS
jgi:hypothetical protein